jgi:hypothetical protein
MFSEIINALRNNGDDAASAKGFYATHELSPESFHIDVEGVGKINFPLDQMTIQKLQGVSSEAKYGLREKTLLDKKVRDTQEIPKEMLTIKCDGLSFSNMLENMRDSMGLSENAKLTAHLHNMLIYGSGQFFKEHQDSEKLDGMIASLVIVLPSAHIGGSLVVNHNNKTYRFTTENIDARKLQCLAFYADCHHEVEKIRQGYRLALTYNLVLESAENQINTPENKQLEKALEEYFVVDAGATAGTQELIYFLDHSYTEHSLRWNMLKGADRERAMDLSSAAHKLGLLPHLALVDLRESWTADGDEDDPDPNELFDHNTTLSYWLDADDNSLPYGEYSISNDDACWTKDTEDFEPFETEFEGYMGNYGNTVDYWYRRAAVVLWPAFDQVAMTFKLDYDAAFKDLMQLIGRPGNEKKVLDIVKKVDSSLYGCATYAVKTDNFKYFASIAVYSQDQDVAKSILNVFSLSIFEGDAIEWVVKLQNLYGVSWFLLLIDLWKSKTSGRRSHSIEKDFDQVVIKLLTAGVDRVIVLHLLDNQINNTVEHDKSALRQTPVALKESIASRIHTLKSLVDACDFLEDGQTTQKLMDHVISNAVLYPAHDLGNMIVEAKAFMDGNRLSAYFLLRDHVARGMRQELDQGIRNPDDWSIHARLSCTCELCKTAGEFLNSKTDPTRIWPLVAHDRGHIIDIFSQLGLPVNLSVEKRGSPHKLVMVKSDKLYETSRERFDKLSTNYEKLTGSTPSMGCAHGG